MSADLKPVEQDALRSLLAGTLGQREAEVLRTLFDDASAYPDIRAAVLALIAAAPALPAGLRHSDGCAGTCGTSFDNPPCPAAGAACDDCERTHPWRDHGPIEEAELALPAGLPDVERLAAAMSSWWRPNDHGQLCPVWTQRRAIQHSPCNCFIEDRSRRHAAHILAALEGSATLPGDQLSEARATIEAMSGDAADLIDAYDEMAAYRTVLGHLLGDDLGRIHDSGCGLCDAGRALLKNQRIVIPVR